MQVEQDVMSSLYFDVIIFTNSGKKQNVNQPQQEQTVKLSIQRH